MKSGMTVARTKHVSKVHYLVLLLAALSLSGSTAWALDPMGPPASALRQGDYKVTLDYSFSQIDLDLGNLVVSGLGTLPSRTIKDFEVHRAYAGLGYGIFENWDAFARLGLSRATFGDSIWDAGEDFKGDNDFAIGAGVKTRFYESEQWRIGALLQISYAEFDGKLDADTPAWIAPDIIEIDITQIQLALGATYFWTDRVSIYAGPFAHMVSGDFIDDFILEDNGVENHKLSGDIDNDLTYGAYLGAQIVLNQNCLFNIEYQQTSDSSAVGLGLMWRI